MARFQNANEFRVALEVALSNECNVAAPEARPAPRMVYAPDSRSNRLLTRRVTTSVALALATLVTVFGTVVLLPLKGVRMGRRSLLPLAVTTPARIAEQPFANDPIPPDPTAAVHDSQVLMDAAPSSSSAAPPSRASARQAEQRASMARGLAGVVKSPSPTLPPNPSPPDDSVSQTDEEAKPQRTGNRFIRALSKLNPFHSRAKNSPVDAERTGSSVKIER